MFFIATQPVLEYRQWLNGNKNTILTSAVHIPQGNLNTTSLVLVSLTKMMHVSPYILDRLELWVEVPDL
jgi:hypothetical protein